MPEESTEFSLIGLIGLIFGFIVVLVFIGLIFAQNVMTSVSDLKQSEQFDSFAAAIGEVCGSQYHTSVWQRTLVVFEEYAIQYKPYATDFSDAEKVDELGCSTRCLCLLRDDKALKCKPMETYEQQSCRNIEIKQKLESLLLTRIDYLSLPSGVTGKSVTPCKYRLNIRWDSGNVIVEGQFQEITTSPGKGSWIPIGWATDRC